MVENTVKWHGHDNLFPISRLLHAEVILTFVFVLFFDKDAVKC